MKIETILVATDFSEDAAAALDAAIELTRRFDAKLELLHVYQLDYYYSASSVGGGIVLPGTFRDDIRKAMEARLKELSHQVAEQGVKVNVRAIQGTPSQAIIDEAERLGADLIVMGTRGQSGLMHVLMGSVAERTVRAAHCPVLSVKADSAVTNDN